MRESTVSQKGGLHLVGKGGGGGEFPRALGEKKDIRRRGEEDTQFEKLLARFQS